MREAIGGGAWRRERRRAPSPPVSLSSLSRAPSAFLSLSLCRSVALALALPLPLGRLSLLPSRPLTQPSAALPAGTVLYLDRVELTGDRLGVTSSQNWSRERRGTCRRFFPRILTWALLARFYSRWKCSLRRIAAPQRRPSLSVRSPRSSEFQAAPSRRLGIVCSARASAPSGGCATPVAAPPSGAPNPGRTGQAGLDGNCARDGPAECAFFSSIND